jgi:PAS domain S-box-containing protein
MVEQEARDEEFTSRILNHLKFKRQGMTTSELARKLKINRNSVAKYLQLLLVSGQVEMQVVGNAKVYSISRRLPISTVLSFSSDLVVFLDSDARIAQVNEAFLEYSGKIKADLVGKTIDEAQIHLLSSPIIPERIREGLLGEKSQLEISVDEGEGDHVYRVKFIPTILESGSKGLTIFLENITAERRAEEAVQRSEERFRSMADLAPFPISLIDSKGRYLYINEKFTRTFGYSLEDIPTGRDWFARAFPDPEFRTQVIESWKSDLMNAPPDTVRPKLLPVTCKDGTVKEILFRPITLYDGNQFIIYENITEERAGSRNLALLAALVEFSDDAIIGRDEEGTIISWNKGAERIYGYSAEEIIRKPFALLVPENRREEQEVIDAKIALGRPVNHYETQHITKNGTCIDISLSLAPLVDEGQNVFGASVICRNVSEKKKVEAALSESEKMYRTLFNSTGTGMMIIEEDSTVSLMNARMEKISGYSRHEIEGKRKWYEYVSDEDRRRMQEFHRIRMEDPDNAPDQYEFSFNSKNKELLFGLMTASIIPDSKRTIVSIIDITQRKLMEKSLEVLNEVLEKKVLEHTRDLIKSNEILNIEITSRKYVEKLLKNQQATTVECLNLMGLAMVNLDLDGNIKKVNRIGLETFGYREEEMIGKNWFNTFIPEKEKKKALRLHERVVKSGLNSNISIEPVISKIGKEIEMVWLALAIHENDGHLSSILLLGEDAPGRSLTALSRHIV